MSDFVSLLKELEGYFDKPFEELPYALHERVLQNFPMSWGKLSPEQRRSFVIKVDALHGNEQHQEEGLKRLKYKLDSDKFSSHFSPFLW